MLPSSISRSYADSVDVFCYEGDVRDKDGPLHSIIPVLSDLSVIPIFPVSYVFSALIRSTRGFNSRLFSVLYEVCFFWHLSEGTGQKLLSRFVSAKGVTSHPFTPAGQ